MSNYLKLCIEADPAAYSGYENDKRWRQDIAHIVDEFKIKNKSIYDELQKLPDETQLRVKITFVLKRSYIMTADLDNMIKPIHDTLFFNGNCLGPLGTCQKS